MVEVEDPEKILCDIEEEQINRQLHGQPSGENLWRKFWVSEELTRKSKRISKTALVGEHPLEQTRRPSITRGRC